FHAYRLTLARLRLGDRFHCFAVRGRQRRGAHKAALPQNLLRDLFHQRRIVAQVLLGILAALTQAHLSVADPRAALFNELVFDGQVEQIALAADAMIKHKVELGLLEGRRNLILSPLDADARADILFAFLDGRDLADVQPNRAVKLESQAAGSRFRVTKHDAD